MIRLGVGLMGAASLVEEDWLRNVVSTCDD